MNGQNNVNRWVDSNRLETVICQEKVLNVCYQTLEAMIHNQTIRLGCQRFGQKTEHHQDELRRIFPLSRENEIAVENKLYDYLVMLRPPYLFLGAVLNLAINLTKHKIDIYRYFSLKNPEDRDLLNKFIEESKEELMFLCRERNYYQDSAMDSQSKVSLN